MHSPFFTVVIPTHNRSNLLKRAIQSVLDQTFVDFELIIVNSSNRGTGRMALEIGPARQREFLSNLGMLDPTPFEIVEAAGGQPLFPDRWGQLSTVTISYGHGLSNTPMHLAAGYAAIANGGHYVSPTILKQVGPQYGPRVMSPETAKASQQILRKVVTDGTASFARIPGYPVSGKTGTADKPKPRGVVTLDEPVETSGDKPRRTAGWTAVPIAAELIGRIAPLLGIRPQVEPPKLAGITLTSN